MSTIMDLLQNLLNPNPGQNRLVAPNANGPNYLTQTGLGPEQLARFHQMSGMGGQAAPATSMPQAGPPAIAGQPQAPMPDQQQTASVAPPVAEGGGFLSRLFGGGQSAGENQTIQWLQQQGLDPGTATMMAKSKPILQAYLLKRSQGVDPKDALQAEKLGLEIEDMRNPKPKYGYVAGKDGSILRTDDAGNVTQVYGGKPDTFRTLSNDEEVKLGLDPAGAYQMGADNKVSKIGGEGTTVNIDQRAEGKFESKLAEGQAESFNTMATEGLNARADVAIIGELEGLLAGQGGLATGVSGWLASRGIGGEGMGDLQAVQSLINKLVPTQRAPGSGTISDADLALFKASLPSLWNQPGGNKIIVNTMKGLAQYKQAQGDIAAQVLSGEMSRQDATKALRALPNPLDEFRTSNGGAAAGAPVAPGAVAPGGVDASKMPPPEGISPEVWKHVPPEKRKLWAQ